MRPTLIAWHPWEFRSGRGREGSGEGFGSLFRHCTGAPRLAQHPAYNRIEAARASRRLPAILDLLADGSLNLSTVRALAPHLRPDSFEALVALAKGRSREVETLVARLAPRPDAAASARVRRAVWLRDGGRCAFVASAGRRCNEGAFLEFHHREPYAIGGEATVANISLRCRQHNAHEGELAFGTSARGIGGEPAGRPGPWVRGPAEFRAPAARPNSPRGELDTS